MSEVVLNGKKYSNVEEVLLPDGNGAYVAYSEGGGSGEDGGYYTPSVSQPSTNTMRVAYSPSKAGMPSVSYKDITLPTGPAGYTPQKGVDYSDGEDGITPHIGENGNWYVGDTDTGKPSRGEKGEKGCGIALVGRYMSAGNVDTYRIQFTDGSYFDYNVTNGTNGTDGVNGGFYEPSVDENGDLGWQYRTGLPPAIEVVNIKGKDGSDASVTKENIEAALGYTPVSPDDIPEGGGDAVTDAVRYNPQELTEEQKAQARKNIGAVGEPFVITVSGNETDGYTLDKTGTEIEEAFASGKQLMCLHGNRSVPLDNRDPIVFQNVTACVNYLFVYHSGTSKYSIAIRTNTVNEDAIVSSISVNNFATKEELESVDLKPSDVIKYVTITPDEESIVESEAGMSYTGTVDIPSGAIKFLTDEGFAVFVREPLLGIQMPLLAVQIEDDIVIATFACNLAGDTLTVGITGNEVVVDCLTAQTTMSNPHALTINGTAYDGSEPVEINIPKGDTGETGQRGTGLLAVTTAPASYTTAVGGITPKYRMSISTIKTQSGVTEVLLGDTVRSSYYHYPIAYLDSSYAYFTTRVSIRGATGAAGAAGSDATVTKENIEAALGYTPVSPDDIPASGGDSVPDYVRTEAERVAAVVQSRQNANTFTFIAASDAHFSTASAATVDELTASITHMGQAMAIIREQVHVDLTVSLGDMVWDALDTPALGMSAMRYVSQCLFGGHTGAVHLRARGNHDSLYGSNKSKGTGLLTDAQVFANVGAWNRGSVYDSENKLGGYCYRDFEDAKLRVIILNSSETNTGGCLYSTQQITWLTNALDLTEKGAGWRSIVMGHHPLDWNRDGGGNPVTAVNNAPGLICSFHGHTHNYLSGTVSGTSLKRLAIPNACSRGRENEYADWGEATTYSKVQGTKDDTAFCVVTIDLAAHKIYADHYGAGYDREIEYVDSGADEPENYRNEVEFAQDANSEALYNGTGYKTGFYPSSSGGDTQQSTGESLIATGYIPYTGLWATGNELYIKGADVTSGSHVRIYGYASKGAKPLDSASCNGSNLESYHFEKEVLEGEHYYKLTHLKDASNVVWLRLSLELPAGYTGEELIVSIGKPIE